MSPIQLFLTTQLVTKVFMPYKIKPSETKAEVIKWGTAGGLTREVQEDISNTSLRFFSTSDQSAMVHA